MKNWKTNLAAIAKVLGALAYITYKQMHSLPLTDADTAIVALAFGGALGNWLSADAKPKDPPA